MIKRILALLAFCLIGCAVEQTTVECCSGSGNTAESVANDELPTFIKIFGGKSIDATKGKVKLGKPAIIKSFMPVEVLMNEKLGEGVLRSTYKTQTTTIFPIVQGEISIGSIEVSQDSSGKWSLVAFGPDDYAASLVFKMRSNNCLGDFRIVSIPAMNLIMVSRETRLSIHLYPIGDHPDYQLKDGKEYDAKELWPKLREIAKTMDFGVPG